MAVPSALRILRLLLYLSVASLLGFFSCPTTSRTGEAAAQTAHEPQRNAEAEDFPTIPSVAYPASRSVRIEELYRFAGTHPELFQYIPCYCLCSKSLHHRSLDECFVRSRGGTRQSIVWSRHAAECAICLSVAGDAQRLYLSGKNVLDIRNEIDRAYRPHFENRTETPDPPSLTLPGGNKYAR